MPEKGAKKQRGKGKGPPANPDGDEPIVELAPFEAEEFFGTARTDQGALDSESTEKSAPVPDQAAAHKSAPKSADRPSGALASDSQHDLLSGLDAPKIPGYAIEGVIGRGATGVVYRARQEAVDRPVALKVLHRELITNRRAVRRLKREARLAARLAHPSIISAIDMGVVNGLWWYAMELVTGVSLARRIAERGSLTERECLRLFSPLCDALQHAHEVGVVHRDIKPANILIDQRGRARLVDLGLAMGQNDPSITRTGSTLGTPHYVSPEQARDPSQADIRSDLWSIGATMYHAVCGRPPFSFDSEDGSVSSGGVAEILSRVLYRPVTDPREFTPELSKGFSLLLRKCLTRDADQRYQEPWELVADIETLRERRRLDLRGSQVDAFASRRPRWVTPALAGMGIALAIGLTWAVTAQPWKDPAPTPVARGGPNLSDWPELRSIKEDFEAGQLTHADALTELRSPSLASLPEEAGFFQSELISEINDSLDRTVSDLLATSRGDVQEALRTREFDTAEAIVTETFPELLRTRTGFVGANDLPPGRVATRALTFQKEETEAVAELRESAMRAAKEALRNAAPKLVDRPVDAFLANGDYAAAIEWLAPVDEKEWLTRKGLELDLRGLDDGDLFEIVSSIDNNISDARNAVSDTAEADTDRASKRLDVLGRTFREDIESDDVKREVRAVERFRTELEAEFEELGFDPEKLPAGERGLFKSQIETVAKEIETQERQQREDLARSELPRLALNVQKALRARDYASAKAVYSSARAETWRASTYDALDVRLAELELLIGLQERAIEGVVRADGTRRELVFKGIKLTGEVQATRGLVFKEGFRFELPRERRFRSDSGPESRHLFVAYDVQRGIPKGAELLGALDLLAFADLADPASREPSDDLAVAAFWLAEGEPAKARHALPLGEAVDEDSVLWDLEQRIGAQLSAIAAEAETRASTRPRQSTESLERDDSEGAKPTIESAYGTPNQATFEGNVRLVWNFEDRERELDSYDPKLRTALPTGNARLGAWEDGGWTTSFDGISLHYEEASKEKFFLREALLPRLELSEPLDTARSVRLTLDLVPGDPQPNPHLFCVSIHGYHAVFVDGRVWFGSGKLASLYAHIQGGKTGEVEGFHWEKGPTYEEGVPVRVVLEIEPKRFEELSVDGETFEFSKLLMEADRADPTIALRSRGPMKFVGAQLEGKEHNPR